MATKDVAEWRARIELANRKWEKEVRPVWEQAVDFLKGNQPPRTLASDAFEEKVVVNMVYANMKILIPRISFRRPRVFVRPRRPTAAEEGFDLREGSKALEALINWYIVDLRIKRQMDRALMDALLGPFGVVKLGYMTEEQYIQDGTILESNTAIKRENPFAVRWSPMDVRVDPEAFSFDEASWIAFRSFRELEDVKKNPVFKNTSNLEANATLPIARDEQDPTDMIRLRDFDLKEFGETFQRVETWEIWDRKNRKLKMMVPGHDRMILDDDWPFDLDDFPAEFLVFNEIPDELIPLSDTETYADQQVELNKLSSMELDHVKRFNRKYVVTEQHFSEEQLEALQQGGDGTILEATSENVNSVWPIPDANMSFDHARVKADIKEQIREIFGVTAFDRGSRANVDTATEAQFIQAPSFLRTDDRRAQFEDYWARVIPKLAAIVRQFKTSDEFIPILGADAESLDPVLFSPSEIPQDVEKEFLFEIEVGSTEPFNDAIRQNRMLVLFQSLNGDPLIDQRELRRRLLEAFGEQERRLLLTNQEARRGAEIQAANEEGGGELPEGAEDIIRSVTGGRAA